MEESATIFDTDLNLKLGLPGRDESDQQSSSSAKNNKRSSTEMDSSSKIDEKQESVAPAPK